MFPSSGFSRTNARRFLPRVIRPEDGVEADAFDPWTSREVAVDPSQKLFRAGSPETVIHHWSIYRSLRIYTEDRYSGLFQFDYRLGQLKDRKSQLPQFQIRLKVWLTLLPKKVLLPVRISWRDLRSLLLGPSREASCRAS